MAMRQGLQSDGLVKNGGFYILLAMEFHQISSKISSPSRTTRYATRYDSRKETLSSDIKMIPPPHTDIGCCSMLYRDKGGCLKVPLKERKWVSGREDSAHSSVINIADCLKCAL
ncbi:hypothetical protein SUGI_0026920 [Cryptomeria japonica]|nr:hypothetical protein SUGI_0026920 [Cryptomeria japonica]